ncbi:hypothetical protein [[Mycobacterium] nativiensis]|uniref:hypothetical protein n=1 Tax=[Mycobacterium] nativiensis TaxID=2855503 RepID=UPI0038B6AD1E
MSHHLGRLRKSGLVISDRGETRSAAVLVRGARSHLRPVDDPARGDRAGASLPHCVRRAADQPGEPTTPSRRCGCL